MEFRGQYAFLSNFFEIPGGIQIHRGGEVFTAPTVEHAYQALKMLKLEDFRAIIFADTPAAAKCMGRQLTKRPDFTAMQSIAVMLELVRRKFEQPDLRARLLATGDIEIVEDNHWRDIFWGRCGGIGANHLGELLMQVRSEIRATEPRDLPF